MDRISGLNFVVNALGKRIFGDRNQTTGTPGTFFNAIWATGVQESILAPVEHVGLVPTDADDTQLLQAITTIQARTLFAVTLGANGIAFQQPQGVAALSAWINPATAQAVPNGFTFTTPAGLSDVHIWLIGGGGGGGDGAGFAGGGGGGGGFVWLRAAVSAGVVFNGLVGAGGANNAAGSTTSCAGGSATGGGGGLQGTSVPIYTGGYCGQGVAPSGGLGITGGLGGTGIYGDNGYLWGGKGGSSFMGEGPPPSPGLTTFGNAGGPATIPGTGGCGGAGPSTGGAGAGATGTYGAGGCVLIWR